MWDVDRRLGTPGDFYPTHVSLYGAARISLNAVFYNVHFFKRRDGKNVDLIKIN